MIYAQRCTIKRAGGTPTLLTTPTTVHSNLDCSIVYEASDEERERWFLTTISRAMKLYVKAPVSGIIQEQDLVYVGGERYYVVKANRWPHTDPDYYELFMEYRRGQ